MMSVWTLQKSWKDKDYTVNYKTQLGVNQRRFFALRKMLVWTARKYRHPASQRLPSALKARTGSGGDERPTGSRGSAGDGTEYGLGTRLATGRTSSWRIQNMPVWSNQQ